MTNKGFTLIEVLISLFILVVAAVTVNAAFKQFTVYKSKTKHYENHYITVLSLKDMIENQDLAEKQNRVGKLNGLDYKYEVIEIDKRRNYMPGETEEIGGNNGAFELTLFKIRLSVEDKEYEFYKTLYKKLFDTTELLF